MQIPIAGKKIDFFTASLEDIVIAKLFSDRDSDARDIESNSVVEKLDWEKLERLATDEHEVQNNALNERSYHTFKYNYEEYVRRFRPCAN